MVKNRKWLNKATLRVLTLAITAVMCTLVILSAVFPLPEGANWNFLSIGTSEKVSANPDWLTGYDYRKEITIHGTTDGEQENYQMPLIVNKTYPIDLTLLNARSSLAFTIAGGSTWAERDFGTTIPSNAKVALCLVKGTTYGDINFKARSTDTNYVTSTFGSGIASFDGSYFVMIPVYDRKCWTENAGTSGDFYVYAVGYILNSGAGNTFFEMFSQDNLVVSAQNPTDWTNVDISSLKVENGDKTIKGAYIAVDSNADQDLYFRASGSSEGGVLWESDTNDPGTHLLGFIPVGSNGIFQYKTGGTNVNIYVLGLIHACPAAQSDKMAFRYIVGTTQTMLADSAWHTYTPDRIGAKAYYVTGIWSPDALNTFKTRPYGSTTMVQNYVDKDSCGGMPILTKSGTDSKIDYWSNAFANGYIYLCAMTVYPTSYNPTGGYCLIDNSKCQSDYDDIRFTKSDSSSLLDYWQNTTRDLATTGDETILWIEFDSIPISPNSNSFYAYYSNSGASSGSNPDNTFLFFDNFELNNLSRWTTTEAQWATQGTVVYQGSYATKGTGAIVNRTLAKDITLSGKVSLEMVGRVTHKDADVFYQTVTQGGGTKYYANWGGGTNVNIQYNDGSWKDFSPALPINVNTWYALRFFFDIPNNKYKVIMGSIETAWVTTVLTTSDITKMKFFAPNYVGKDVYFDNIIVRKWADPEPIWGAWGSEEGINPEITNSPDNYGFGVIPVNTTANTGIGYFTLNNTGNCAVDVAIYGVDLTGGNDTWTLSGDATPGVNIYGLQAGLDDADDNFDVTVNATANAFISGLVEGVTQDWGLKIWMPTSLSGYDAQQMSGTITLVASESS